MEESFGPVITCLRDKIYIYTGLMNLFYFVSHQNNLESLLLFCSAFWEASKFNTEEARDEGSYYQHLLYVFSSIFLSSGS